MKFIWVLREHIVDPVHFGLSNVISINLVRYRTVVSNAMKGPKSTLHYSLGHEFSLNHP